MQCYVCFFIQRFGIVPGFREASGRRSVFPPSLGFRGLGFRGLGLRVQGS